MTPLPCMGVHSYTEVDADGLQVCVCGQVKPEPAPASVPAAPISDEEFESQLVAVGAAAAAARGRLGASSSPPPGRLSEGFRLTVPPPEALERGAAYWAEQKALEEQRERDAERRRREARARTAASKLPPNFAWAAFEEQLLGRRVQNRTAIELARKAAETDELRVVLTGPAGSGKTSLAAAMFRLRYILRGGSVAFEPAWELSSARSRHALGAGEPEVVRRALDAELLVLDDFGTEKSNLTSAIDDVVFHRHWMAKITWVTTAKSLDEIKERYGDGIARRLFEGAAIIECGRS